MQTLNDIKPSLQNLTDGKFGKLRDNQHAVIKVINITCVRLSVLDPEQSGVQSVTSGVFLDQSATLWPK